MKFNVVSWFEGCGEPKFSFFSQTHKDNVGGSGMTPPIAIRNPERFGWPASGKVTVVKFKAFVQAFADAMEV